MVRAITIALAVALAASIGLNIAARREPQLMTPFEYFPNMVRQARYNAFEANPSFPDGMTLRVPPAGTIPRELPPLASDSSAAPLENPFPLDDRDALERGKVVFDTFCLPCHGAGGQGDGLVVQHGFPQPPPLTRARTRSMTDAQIFGLISNGTGGMPPYAVQVSREDRWKAIVHLRQLQRQPPPAVSAK
jgi:mono/diheme cytochrome c family protein